MHSWDLFIFKKSYLYTTFTRAPASWEELTMANYILKDSVKELVSKA